MGCDYLINEENADLCTRNFIQHLEGYISKATRKGTHKIKPRITISLIKFMNTRTRLRKAINSYFYSCKSIKLRKNTNSYNFGANTQSYIFVFMSLLAQKMKHKYFKYISSYSNFLVSESTVTLNNEISS